MLVAFAHASLLVQVECGQAALFTITGTSSPIDRKVRRAHLAAFARASLRIELVIRRLALGVAFALARVRVQVESGLAALVAFAFASMRIQVEARRALASADQRAGSVIDRVALGSNEITFALASFGVQIEIGETFFQGAFAITAAFIENEIAVALFALALALAIIFIEEVIGFAFLDLARIFERTRAFLVGFDSCRETFFATSVSGGAVSDALAIVIERESVVTAVDPAAKLNLGKVADRSDIGAQSEREKKNRNRESFREIAHLDYKF